MHILQFETLNKIYVYNVHAIRIVYTVRCTVYNIRMVHCTVYNAPFVYYVTSDVARGGGGKIEVIPKNLVRGKVL